MIVYFSAEGNSCYVAVQLARLLNDTACHIAECNPKSNITPETLIIISPVYSWGLPVPVVEWMKELSFAPAKYCAAVLTCGDDTGNAHKLLSRQLHDRGIELNCCVSIQMPNTYVVLPGFNVDSPEVERSKLTAAAERISHIAEVIRNRENITDVVTGSFAGFKTSVIYPLFLRFGISTRKFHFTSACIGCGKCARVCPRQNITMQSSPSGQTPSWGNDCVSCLACYHHCPVKAVQYGKITKNKGQYVCPFNSLS